MLFRSTLSDEPESRYNSVGKPSQHVTIKLIENEVCISGPHLFSGYWNLPDETAQSLQKDWLHTGDLGKIDKDGYLRITGRIKDLINIGGAKVSGQEVDYVLKKHPLVKDAVSVGIKDPEELRGEVVGTLVVSNTPIQDQNKLTQSLREFCSDYLEAHMIPEKIIYSDHIPLTENGKINKRNIISCLS